MRELVNPASLKQHLSTGKKTAVLFILSACPYCRAFRPLFEHWGDARADKVDPLTVVLDDFENPLWEDYRINVVPTVLLFDGERIATRLDGRPGEGLTAADLEKLT